MGVTDEATQQVRLMLNGARRSSSSAGKGVQIEGRSVDIGQCFLTGANLARTALESALLHATTRGVSVSAARSLSHVAPDGHAPGDNAHPVVARSTTPPVGRSTDRSPSRPAAHRPLASDASAAVPSFKSAEAAPLPPASLALSALIPP